MTHDFVMGCIPGTAAVAGLRMGGAGKGDGGKADGTHLTASLDWQSDPSGKEAPLSGPIPLLRASFSATGLLGS